MDWNRVTQTLNTRPPRPIGQGHPSAVLALLAGDRLVLEVRSKSLRHQPGEICLPGGGLEQDETPVQCALRETREELGIPEEALQVAGPLDFHLHSNGRVVYPVLARCDEAVLGRLRPNPAEVEEVFSVPLAWFRQNPPIPYQYRQENTGLEALPPQMADWLSHYPTLRRGGYWAYEGKLIWGLTARVVAQVVQLETECK